MRTLHTIVAAVVIMSLAAAGDAWAQHEGHRVPAATGPAARNPDCAQAGRKALAMIEAASGRLETARRSNSGADLQVTMTEAQLAVAAAQAELFTCRAAVPTASEGAPPPAEMAAIDHSKMNMGKPAAGVKPTAQGEAQAAPMAGMDHSKMAMGGATARPGEVGGAAKLPVMMAERIADPACAGNVGQATAPKAVFERKVYYFCSTAARDEFRRDPAAYLKKHPR